MYNKANVLVTPTSSSINYAINELIQPVVNQTSIPDLTDGSGVNAWPITMMDNLIIRTNLTVPQFSCYSRTLVINFLEWFYTSNVASSIASSNQVSICPSTVVAQLNILSLLATTQCNNTLVSAVHTTEQLTVMGTTAMNTLPQLLITYHTEFDVTNTLFNYTGTTSVLSYQHLLDQQSDMSWTTGNQLPQLVHDNPTLVNHALDNFQIDSPNSLYSNSLFNIPVFGISAVPVIYLPGLNSSSNTLGIPLNMTADMIAGVLLGLYHSYMDVPNITQLNPAVQPSVFDLPVTLVLACSNYQLRGILQNKLSMVSAVYQQYGLHTDATQIDLCTNYTYTVPVAYVRDENTLPTIVSTISGAFGVTLDYASQDLVGTSKIQLYNTTHNITYTSDAASILACSYDTFHVDSMYIDLSQSTNTSCWPFSQSVFVSIHSYYTQQQSLVGAVALNLLSWLQSFNTISTTAQSFNIARLSDNQQIYDITMNRLNHIYIGGTTGLVQYPVIYAIPSGIQLFAYITAALCISLCSVILWVVYRYRGHSIFKAASVPFQYTELFGVILLYVSTIVWVQTPTPVMCTTFNWLINLAFKLTFSPLFVKIYRLHRIFNNGKKLQRVKLSNAKLSVLVLVDIAADIIILSTMQILSPLQPVTTLMENNNTRYSYTYCSAADRTAIQLLIVLGGLKGILLLFGSVVAFTTRKVSTQFSESSQVAWSIYNTIFASVLLIGIIGFTQSSGTALYILVLILILWISTFAVGILFIPKCYKILFPGNDNTKLSSLLNKSNNSTVYSLPSLSNANIATLPQYIQLVEQHLIQAKQRLIKLRQVDVDTANGTSHGSTTSHHNSVKQSCSNNGSHAVVSPWKLHKSVARYTNDSAVSYPSRHSFMTGVNAIMISASNDQRSASVPAQRRVLSNTLIDMELHQSTPQRPKSSKIAPTDSRPNITAVASM